MESINLETLKNIKKTQVVELPSFDDGTPFIVEVKRPNLMNLISANKIPNNLLNVAMLMFKTGVGGVATKATEDVKTLKELASLMQVVAESSLVTPSYQFLKENEIELTEAQLVEMLNYMQGGVQALKSFRDKQKHNKSDKSSE